METLLHLIGLCPDSISHIDLTDIMVCYYNEIISIINLIKIKLQ